MIAKSWRFALPSAEQGWRLGWRCCSGAAINADAAEPKPTKRRRRTPKLTDKKTKPADKAPRAGKVLRYRFQGIQAQERSARAACRGSPRADLFSSCMTYNVGSRDERPRAHRLCPSFRAYVVSGLGECRQGRAFYPDPKQRRQRQRHDQHRPHQLLSKLSRPISWNWRFFSKPTACARRRSTKPISTISARPCKRSAGRTMTTGAYGKTYEAVIDLAYDNFRLQAFDHRLHGGSQCRDTGRCHGVFPHLLRAQ